MASKQSREIYRNCRDQILHIVGHRRAMGSDEIETLCRALFGSKFKGVTDSGHFKNPVPGYYILNTAYSAKSNGVHWISCVVHGKIIYVFDSYGRSSTILINHLEKMVDNSKYDLIDINHEPFQRNSNICGQLSIAFLSMVDLYGLPAATLV